VIVCPLCFPSLRRVAAGGVTHRHTIETSLLAALGVGAAGGFFARPIEEVQP
jgi:hypothetical protein